MERTITIKGIGQASAKPDLIMITMALTTAAADYEKTILKANAELEALRAAIVSTGFNLCDIRTTDFTVDTDYVNKPDKNGVYKQVLNGYCCQHSLKIELDFNMNRLSNIVRSVSQCKASPKFTILFSVRNKKPVLEQLMQSCSENAFLKAKLLAKASGVRLGMLQSIDYSWGEIQFCSPTQYKNGSDRLQYLVSSKMEIEPDDISVTNNATFVWEIL